MHPFWIVVLILVGVAIAFAIYALAYEEWAKSRNARQSRARNERLQAEQAAERENRAFLAGHDAGIYGDYVPIDLETGEPMKVTRPDRARLTSDRFKSQHRRPGNPV